MENSQMIIFNNDLWIKKKYFINNKPNIYWAYVWQEDIKDIEYRRKVPWIKIKKAEINLYLNMISKNQRESLKILAEQIQKYTKLKFKSQKDFVRALIGNIKNSMIDMISLRVLCLIASNLSNKSDKELFFDIISKSEYITDYTNLGRFSPPLSKKDLLNEKTAYIAGCQAGDGYLSKKYIATIVDGYKNKEKLSYSKKHIYNLKKIIEKTFNTHCFIDNGKGYYRVNITNKWYVRHLHKFFNLPIGNKKNNLVEPTIIKSVKQKSKFWQGLFDSDGNARNLTIELTESENLMNQLEHFLKKANISYTKTQKENRQRITVLKKDAIKFNKVIGFNHPRKKEEIEQTILKGSKFTVFKGLRSNAITKRGFYNLVNIGDLMIHRFGNNLKGYKDKSGLSYYKLAELFNLAHSTVITALQNKNAINLKRISNFYEYINLSVEDLYKDIERAPQIMFRSGKGKNLIYLPVKPSKEISKIVEYLSPQKKRNLVYIKTRHIAQEKLEAISKIFKAKITKNPEGYVIRSKGLCDFLTTFYRYEKPW